VFFLLFFVFVFCGAAGQSAQELCWFIPGVVVGILHDAWCSPVDLPNVSQPGLEPASGGVVALLFSQCNMAWRSFPQSRGAGVKVLILLASLFLPSVAPASPRSFQYDLF
jgi:hypothetical protein